MLNQVVLVGRLTDNPELKDEKINLVIAVPRSFKNADGNYETDFIECVLYGALATNTKEYCQKGDVVGIKGRIQSEIVDDKRVMAVIVEKLTFLSSKRENKENE